MFRNILQYGVSEGLAKLIPFAVTLYIAKNLPSEMFGKYSLILVMFEIVFLVVSFNIQATTRIDYFKKSKVDFVTTKGIHLAISGAITLAVPLFSYIFYNEYWWLVLYMASITYMRTLTALIQSIFQCSKRVIEYTTSNILFIVSLAISTMFFFQIGEFTYCWAYGMGVASVVQLSISIYQFGYRNVLEFFNIEPTVEKLRATFAAALLFMPQAIGWWLKTGADRAIISNGLGNGALGEYVLAYQFTSVILILTGTINLALVPVLNQLLKSKNHYRIGQLLVNSCVAILFLCGATLLVANIAITEYFGSEYSRSSSFLLPLVIELCLQALMLLPINILYYEGKGTYVAKLILISFSFQSMVNFLFIRSYGVYGLITCSIVINLFVLISVWRSSKKSYTLRNTVNDGTL